MDATQKETREIQRRGTYGVEIPIAVPPIRVWKALVEPEDMKTWFCEHADVATRLGGPFRFGGRYTYRLDGPEGGGQSILSHETARSLAFSWDVDGVPTRVRFVLSRIRGDCRLRVFHECGVDPHLDWRGGVADYYPWENYLLNLKMYLERGNPGIRIDYSAVPEGKQRITGEVRCASERIWRVLTDRDECLRRFGEAVDFDPDADEGWTEPFGKVTVAEAVSGRMLRQFWEAEEGGGVHILWDLVPHGVTSNLSLTTWGEGPAEKWHSGRPGLWTHLLWCRIVNELKYYAETGSPSGLRRLVGEA